MKQLVKSLGVLIVISMILAVLLPQAAWSAGFDRRDISFKSQGLKCAGWYYVPKDLKPGEKRPAIVMTLGFSAVKEMGLNEFAQKMAEAGFVVLAFDYRYLGASEGEPRGQIFYYEQQEDYRNAITWISLQKEVDPQRIGIWGTSYSGGHVLHLAAFDKRVKAVVAMEPFIDAWDTFYKNMKPEELAMQRTWYAKSRMEEYERNRVNYLPVVAPDGQPAVISRKGAYSMFMEASKNAPTWQNRVTVESLEVGMEYAPAAYINLISPTPLLMIIPSHDTVLPTQVQKNAFQRALEPKKMVIVKGDHFDLYYGPGFTEASAAAVEWFRQYLKP